MSGKERAHPLQNRVTPLGDIVAAEARGLFMGNRGGRFHRGDQTLSRHRWKSKAWITCQLEFRGRHRAVMGEGYTELFFLDEATALAAGHRPCFECRRKDARRFSALWQAADRLDRPPRAGEMDRILHTERRASGGPGIEVPIAELPDAAMVLLDGAAWLVLGGQILRWTPGGYGDARPRPEGGEVAVLTPPSILGVLSAGYQPVLHPSAISR